MKKLLTIAIVAVLVVALVACSTVPAASSAPTASSAAPASASEVAPASSAAPATVSEVALPSAAPAPDFGSVKANKEYKIGITLMDYNFTFFQDMLAAMKKEAAAVGVTTVDFNASQDVNKQLNAVEDMINGQKVDALLLNPVDSSAIVAAVQAANDANIPVITVDVTATGGTLASHVSSSNELIGATEAQFVVDTLTQKYGSPKGTIIVNTYPKISSIQGRETGFDSIMNNYPDIKVIKKTPVQLTENETMNLMADALQTYQQGQLDMIDSLNSTMCLGTIAALETAGRTDVQVVGTDDDPGELTPIADPNSFVVATVVQYPTDMGKYAIDLAVKALNGDTDIQPAYSTQIKLVTKDNIADYQKEHDQIEADIAPFKSK